MGGNQSIIIVLFIIIGIAMVILIGKGKIRAIEGMSVYALFILAFFSLFPIVNKLLS